MHRIGKTVEYPRAVFRDRDHAGHELASAFISGAESNAVVLAVPRGGVPIGAGLAEALGAPLDLVMVRKLPIPGSPEAGFGAVGMDGSLMLSDPIVIQLRLMPWVIEDVVQEVLKEVRRRAQEYLGHTNPPDVRGKHVYVVDDGLATGYTMFAASRMLRKLEPKELTLCVPVSPLSSITAAEAYFDDVRCMVAQRGGSFAVASYYEDFRDLRDEEVRERLHAANAALVGKGGKNDE